MNLKSMVRLESSTGLMISCVNGRAVIAIYCTKLIKFVQYGLLMQNISDIVLRQKSEIEGLSHGRFVKRDIEIGEGLLRSKLIKAVLGPRRAGKSVFSIQSIKDRRYAYLNFDEEQLVRVDDYDVFLKGLREVYGSFDVLLLDEVQNLLNWELFVNRLQRSGLNLIITGSNSRLLGRELATHLTGRHIPVLILPFSFKEFLRARDVDVSGHKFTQKENQGEILRDLREYMVVGGFPEVVVKGLDHRTYLSTLFDSVVLKDVVRRHNVRFSSRIYDLARYLMDMYSSELSFTRAKNVLGLGSVHTVENYTKYLVEAFPFFLINRFSFKAKDQLTLPKKVYSIDVGLVNALSLRTTENRGKIMENLVAIDLLRRSNLLNDTHITFWKDYQKNEVDFVLRRGLKIEQLIQVTYASGRDEIEKREIKAMVKAGKELKCKDLLIISWDYEGDIRVEGKSISCVPLWKWLLFQ